jgi:membrane associated rhomboid family serine protease/Tfp pilus assembly protein PilF
MQLVTTILFALNVIIFLLTYKENPSYLWHPSGEMVIQAGGDYAPLFANGQYWRALSCGFVHVGAIHLAVNMFALSSVCGALEQQVGALKFILIYFISLICGSFVSLYFHPFVVSAGASGAIFGVLGAQAIMVFTWWKHMKKSEVIGIMISNFIMIGLYLVIGSFFPQIDNYAHIGGLIGGIGAALALMPLSTEGKLPKLANLVAISSVIFSLVYASTLVLAKTKQSAEQLMPVQIQSLKKSLKEDQSPCWLPTKLGSPEELLGPSALQCTDYPTAIQLANKEVDLDHNNTQAYYLRALVQHKFKHENEALSDAGKALTLRPDDYTFLLLRAKIEMSLKHYDKAITDLRAALKTDRKEHAEAEDVMGTCYQDQGNKKEALRCFTRAISQDKELGAAYFHRAKLHQLSGEKTKAEQDFIRAQNCNYVNDADNQAKN